MPMNPQLRRRLAAAGLAGATALGLAGVMGDYYEGARYVPYLDPVGIPTVCRGITGPAVVWGKYYTEDECHTLEQKALQVAEKGVMRQIPNYHALNRWQQAALIDFTYNAGEQNLATSTMRKDFNAGNYKAGCVELTKWVKSRKNGQLVTLPGLVTRRNDEEDLCLNWKDTP